jgi:RNA polymerase sigma-70 factor (ECF subfamily)
MTEDSSKQTDSDERRWAALMRNAQAGHEAEYRQLLQELSGVVRHYLWGRFGREDFVDDCVQESLVAIHEARHSYDPARAFRPWFFAIVRYKAIDTLRRQQRHRNLVERQTHEQHSLEETAEANQVEAQMVSGYLFRSLSPQHLEAITLTKLKGYSIAEAAVQLNISEGALKIRVHRGIGRLKRLVEAEKL